MFTAEAMLSRLGPGDSLPTGGSVVSPNGQYKLIMREDGNLVLYRMGGAAKWASNTRGGDVGKLAMQVDGNLVMYDVTGNWIWASATHGNAGAFLLVQDDGNVVIYHPAGGALWSTSTSEARAGDRATPSVPNLIRTAARLALPLRHGGKSRDANTA